MSFVRGDLAPILRILAVAVALAVLGHPANAHPAAALAPARYVPVLHEGDALPDFVLVDQRARRVTLHEFRGSALVVSFIYTRCADARMCPLVSAKFGRLQHAIGRERIHLLEVTLDPGYDTPSVLARYAARFAADPARWTLATGNPAEVAELSARVGITGRRAVGRTFMRKRRRSSLRMAASHVSSTVTTGRPIRSLMRRALRSARSRTF